MKSGYGSFCIGGGARRGPADMTLAMQCGKIGELLLAIPSSGAGGLGFLMGLGS